MAFFACGTHFEQAPALPGLPGSVTTWPFGSGGAEFNLVNEGAVGALIFVDVVNGLSLCWLFTGAGNAKRWGWCRCIV